MNAVEGSKGHILFISTTDRSVHSQLRGQLGHLRSTGWHCTLVTTDTGIARRIADEEDVCLVPLTMRRSPSPVRDVVAFFKIVRVLRRKRPDVVVYGTPKASMLGAAAALVARVPRRIYFLYGLRLETTTGFARRALTAIERFVIGASTDTLSVGSGLVEAASHAGLPPRRMTVLGRGSANGVDVQHYRDRAAQERASRVKRTGQGVVGFVGRLTSDKGIDQLLLAVDSLRRRGADVELLLIGPDEGTQQLPARAQHLLGQSWVRVAGNVADTAPWYGRMDVLCLPSLREGLPTVILEAAAAGTPVVVTDFTGAADVVQNGVTGTIVPIGDVAALASGIERSLTGSEPDSGFAEAAHRAVLEHFDTSVIWPLLDEFYSERPTATSR
ncbi:glycosyltransferase [Frigoribacterium sp. PvP032]|uniref:glycosyltransferase n=1 Tax=Frigoribacterium sp. PvP032 TaxID=2806589 RepID=UPI001AE1D269|nr:glycosyltransferase [Frigoribacterium sp. PvP032]MBP1190432.1 glycosyltransferase involved in cell wall biosynthesis [Frigoribacterium sp. PvP032]